MVGLVGAYTPYEPKPGQNRPDAINQFGSGGSPRMTTDERLKAIRQSLASGWSVALCGPKDVAFLLAALDAARAKDAEAHAAELAAKDAEIARLRAQVQQWRDHIDRSAEIENVADLYRHDPQAMADAIVRLREDVGALRAEKD